MKIEISKSLAIFLGIIFVGAILRFYNPLWDNGLFLHPDERLFVNASNLALPISWQQFFSPTSPLNPHMFYYGSLLLYIYKCASLLSPFSFLVTSRLVSALLSTLSIICIFFIGKELFSKKVGVLSSLVLAFAPGSIQYAHFNTTESMLIFLVCTITYTDILIVKRKNPRLLTLSFILVAIAGATKITGLLFGISPCIAMYILIKERVSWKQTILSCVWGIILGGFFYLLVSPYQFIDLPEFLTQQSYMQSVTYGVFKPPFVIIYEHTPVYIYQLIRVFPFIFGFASFPLSLIGLVLLFKGIFIEKKRHFVYVFLFAFPLIYFAWSGAWYAKFARYYLLLIPFLSIWAGFVLGKLSKLLLYVLLVYIVLNGLLFARIYTAENTRVAATKWIYSHLPTNATIATEHWDDSLPLVLPRIQDSSFHMVSLTVYDTDTPAKALALSQTVSSADFIVLSSRRVYASILNNPTLYPYTTRFYYNLFTSKLGFKRIYLETNYPFFISDDFADETFQSYDHPPVLIFQNTKRLSSQQIFSLIQ